MSVKHCFKMPKSTKITGRSSTISSVFASAIVPMIDPTETEVSEALAILGLDGDDLKCVYCGDTSTEWDHLRPLIKGSRPTGYISEIANLVPACGKCNQSKGNKDWREWMLSKAVRSPKTRGIHDIEDRIRRLEAYSQWRDVRRIDFEEYVGKELWDDYWQEWRLVLVVRSVRF